MFGEFENALLCGRYDRRMSASIRKRAQRFGDWASFSQILIIEITALAHGMSKAM
jgi:hypothetical protein